MSDKPRRPAAFRLEPSDSDAEETPAQPPETPKPTPKSTAKMAEKHKKPSEKIKRKPRALKAPEVKIEDGPVDQPLVPARQSGPQVAGAMRWLSILFTASAALFTMWVGLTITGLIEDLFSRSPILGWIGTGVLGVVILSLLVIIGREIAGLFRLKKLETVQRQAAQAIAGDDKTAASNVLSSLHNIYDGRPDTAWGLARLKDSMKDVMDPADRIRLVERDLMSSLDDQAGRIIARAGRRVALITAITPIAALDILMVAFQNLQMLRAIADNYGGRPGTLGTFRLARMVIGHLAVTGGLALTDNLVQQFIGKGLIGRLSSRFGEGAVNGILTARIGLAALDLCRPVPFVTGSKPALSDFLREIVNFDSEDKPD